MILFTIGFAGRDAMSFFEALKAEKVTMVIDIRRSNTSQLAGFTKKSDLPYLLEQICEAGYEHHPELSPGPDLFKSFRSRKIEWDEFSQRFQSGVQDSRAVEQISTAVFDRNCLLCACSSPDQCHRLLVARLLADQIPGLEVRHL